MTIKTAIVVLTALTSAAAVGCAGGGGSDPAQNPAGQTAASLHRAKDCNDLLGDLKADANWKIDRSVDYQIRSIKECQARNPDSQCASHGGYYGGGGLAPERSSDDAMGAPTSGGAASSSSGSSGSSGNSSSSGGAAPPAGESAGNGGGGKTAGSYSETNTQVKGVDEADIVKTDGANIYVLHGNAFKVIQAYPANTMKETGTLDIEGSPTEMFVADGKVVVYSQVNGANVLAAANIQPRKQYVDYGFGYATSSSGGAPRGDIAAPYPGGGGTQPSVYVPLTKVTILALNAGGNPVVTRESWFEGSYLDSRRVGSSVRTVFQGNSYGPQLKYGIYELVPPSNCSTPGYDPNTGAPPPDYKPEPCVDNYPKTGTETIKYLEQLRSENHAAVEKSVLGDWLPYTFVRANGATTASTTACQDFYVPTTGSTESGITAVSTLDLADPNGAPRETAILGRADTVYGNAESLYLAAHAYVEPPFVRYEETTSWGGDTAVGSSSGSGGTEATPTPAPGVGTRTIRTKADPQAATSVVAWSQNNTHIHKFEFQSDPKFANYQASGTVRGSVKDQFSLDEKDGFLRIATTENRSYHTADNVYVPANSEIPVKGAPPPARPQSVSHLFVLGQQGAWLGVQGDVGELAPNERIFSVRFVDTKGYVVTFRQVDPLFVIDLATPQKPAVLGELTIPGFSEYMHPIDAGHLLTIGRDGDGQLALQMFDVTIPTQPKQKFILSYSGGGYAQSDASYDHKAFTYFADKKLLALPFTSYNYSNSYGMRSSLEIFKIDVNEGIKHLGDIDGSSLVTEFKNGYCGGSYGYGPSVRRGLFLDNTVYAISYGGIAAKDVGDLAANPITFKLPSPQAIDYYGAPIACDGGGGGEVPPEEQK